MDVNRMYVYVIYSPSIRKFYVGISKYQGKRIRQHSHGQTSWTSRATDWQEQWRTDVGSVSEARALEKKIKQRGARRYLLDLGVAVPLEAG